MSTTPVHQVQVLGHVQRFLTSFVVKDNEPRVCQEHSVGLAVPLRPRFDSPSSSPMLLRTAAEMSRLGHEKRGELREIDTKRTLLVIQFILQA